MPTLKLYSIPINSSAQFESGLSLQQQLALEGAIDEDLSTATQQGSDPGERTLSWNIRSGTVAPMIAKEVREIGDASGIDTVPLYAPGVQSDVDGYYAIESTDVSRAAPQQDEVWVAETTLRREGGGAHYRSTSCTLAQPDNPFGNDTSAPVAVSANASTLQWTDDHGARAPVASSHEIETRSGQYADVRVFDALEAPYDDPTLCYELAFADEMRANPVLWDTRGNASKLDSDSNRQWQHVFSTEHDAEGAFVFDSMLLRLGVDQSASAAADQLDAETYDGSSWTATSLGDPSGWELFECDARRAADDRLEAQLTFSDGSQFFELDMQVALGADSVLFSLPNGGPLPGGLETWLSPIAATHVYDCQPELDVVAKREVRQ